MQFDFSIVIPAYNEEKLIANLLNELLKYKNDFNFEIIVSDGGSFDKTLDILKGFDVKVVNNLTGERQTIGEGRNLGAEQAKGKVLAFINADTMPKNTYDFLSKISNFSKGNIYQNSVALAGKVEPFPEDKGLKDLCFYAFFNSYFKLLNVIGLGMGRGECQILYKETFFNVDGYNPNIAAGEDFDLYRRIAQNNKVTFADDIIVLESPRRFRQKGYLNTILKWFLNGVTVMFTGKSYSKEWELVR